MFDMSDYIYVCTELSWVSTALYCELRGFSPWLNPDSNLAVQVYCDVTFCLSVCLSVSLSVILSVCKQISQNNDTKQLFFLGDFRATEGRNYSIFYKNQNHPQSKGGVGVRKFGSKSQIWEKLAIKTAITAGRWETGMWLLLSTDRKSHRGSPTEICHWLYLFGFVIDCT